MKIAAAEPKRTDGGTSRVAIWFQPWPGFCVDIKRRIVGQQRCGRLVDLDRGRQHAMLQRQDRLDDPRRTSSGLGMSDLGLDRADGTPRPTPTCRLIDVQQAGHFGRVANLRSGTVSFDQFNRVRRDTRHTIRVLQTADLPLGLRSVHGVPCAIAGSSDPLQNRVDSIAVPFGVGQAFQDDDANPLTQDRAIGGF